MEYAVIFVLDKTLGFVDMYQLVIEEIHQSRAKYDISVEKTLIAIIEDFLKDDSHILAFVCDTSDSREAARCIFRPIPVHIPRHLQVSLEA